MLSFQVGKSFPLNKVNDGVVIDFISDGICLTLGLRGITNEEVFYFKHGKIRMDLSYVNNIIFLPLQIDGVIELSDAPFPISSSSGGFQDILSLTKDISLIHLFLVETRSNTLKAIRLISMPKEFLETLTMFIENQIGKNLTAREYDICLEKTYRTLSSYDLRKMNASFFET